MSDFPLLPGSDPFLSRMTSADAAMVQARSKLSEAQLKNIDEASKNFESMFISEMLGQMFNSVGVDEVFGGGQAEETWRSLMVEEYGKQITNAGGIGIADSVKAKMIEIQEVSQQ